MKLPVICILVLSCIVAFSLPAKAGTFCVVGQAVTPQCLYEDVASCTAATSTNTYCDINPDARIMYYGSQPYCIVGSDRIAQCLYIDRGQCNSEAGKARAICTERAQDSNDISPYRYDNRIQK